MKIKKRISSIFHSFMTHVCVRSWWVIAFVLLCLILYEQSLQERAQLHFKLTNQLSSLQKEKQNVIREREDLELQINSQSDLAWIELTLMKGLGLVPEDQEKIFFYPDGC